MVSTIVVCSGGCSSVPKRCGLVLVYFECITSSVCDVLGSRSVIRERERDGIFRLILVLVGSL